MSQFDSHYLGCVLFYERISEWAMIGYMLAPLGAVYRIGHIYFTYSVLHNEFTNGPKGWSLN
jgi:hypothetical protein